MLGQPTGRPREAAEVALGAGGCSLMRAADKLLLRRGITCMAVHFGFNFI